MPERDRLAAGEPDRAGRVAVVERAGEGDDADPRHVRPSSTRTVKSSITGLASRVSARSRIWASRSSVTWPVDLELEALALTDIGDAVEAEPRQAPGDRLALRVEDLGLEHDVDDDACHPGHSCKVGVRSRGVVRCCAASLPAYVPGSSRARHACADHRRGAGGPAGRGPRPARPGLRRRLHRRGLGARLRRPARGGHRGRRGGGARGGGPRELHVAGRPFRTGYVEGVGTEPGRQRAGLGSLASAQAGDLVRAGFELGALSTGRPAFYEHLGWERWRGPTYVRRGNATVRTPDEDDGVLVLRFGPRAAVDLTAPLSCEARAGDDW